MAQPYISTNALGELVIGQGIVVGGPTGSLTNVVLGSGAANATMTGTGDVFVGQNAGTATTTGASNVFVGQNAGAADTTGASNVFVGAGAGAVGTTGGSNTALGAGAGALTTTGATNVFVGQSAGAVNTTGSSLVAVGQGAGPAGGSTGLTNATCLGQGATTSASNTCVLGAGQSVVESAVAHVFFTTLLAGGLPATLTAAQLVGGIIYANGGGAGAYTLPTPASMVAAIPNCAVGSTIKCKIFNGSGGALTIVNTGAFTQAGTISLANNTGAVAYIQVTNITGGTQACVIYA